MCRVVTSSTHVMRTDVFLSMTGSEIICGIIQFWRTIKNVVDVIVVTGIEILQP